MAKPRKGETGVCKLTGKLGPFVKSHIIPRALARPREGGEAFPQFGQGRRPSGRFDSWYDLALVTRDGENILTSYDTFAIQELKRLKLLWQSWGPILELCTSDWERFPGTPNGIRRVFFSDPGRMRLFFLSLLWRAAATNLKEFAEIQLKASDMRRLRRAVRDCMVDLADDFFPITLTQISTRGVPHNLGPIAQVKRPVEVGKYTSKAQPVLRFYCDGLVIHFHTSADKEAVNGLRPMLVGVESGTTLSTVTWESSWQALNMAYLIADADHEFPGAISRADRRQRHPA